MMTFTLIAWMALYSAGRDRESALPTVPSSIG